MLTRRPVILTYAFLFMFAVVLHARTYGTTADDIDLATRVYPTNSARAIDILLNAYRRSSSGLPLIKSGLYGKQFHHLYADLLERLPTTKETADEKLQMSLIIGKKEGFLTAFSNYLLYYPAVSVADKYPDLLLKGPDYLEVLGENYSKELFLVMKTAVIRMRKPILFDQFLERPAVAGKIDPVEVKRYVLESWPVKHRDLRPLLELYRLNGDPDLSALGVYLACASGDYARALSSYPASYLAAQGKESGTKAMGIDLPFLFFTALFREGRYSDAIRDIRRFYFPEINDLPELRYLCYLGLGDRKSAAAEVQSIRNESKADLYTGLLRTLDNPSNGAEYLEKYVEELDESQKYLSAALLLYYSMVRRPERTAVTAEQVKDSLLFRETAPIQDVSLSFAFGKRKAAVPMAGKPDGAVGSFVKYEQAVDWSGTDRKDEAKKAFFELIRSSNTSPVIRSLAVYRARELD